MRSLLSQGQPTLATLNSTSLRNLNCHFESLTLHGSKHDKICLQQGKSLEHTAATNSHTGKIHTLERGNNEYNKHAGCNQVTLST